MPAVIRTASATPLERVSVEMSRAGGAHVWLRRNVVQVDRDFDGTTVQTWEADEVYIWMQDPPPLDAIERDFATLWASAVGEDDLPARIDELTAAVAELADMLAGGE
ncbi:MAG: hypothetical protein GX875_05590 [Propionibacterium sp.]|nr:hypothetical protein [Propionibacterium sp.]